jgi:hypothetical protein
VWRWNEQFRGVEAGGPGRGARGSERPAVTRWSGRAVAGHVVASSGRGGPAGASPSEAQCRPVGSPCPARQVNRRANERPGRQAPRRQGCRRIRPRAGAGCSRGVEPRRARRSGRAPRARPAQGRPAGEGRATRAAASSSVPGRPGEHRHGRGGRMPPERLPEAGRPRPALCRRRGARPHVEAPPDLKDARHRSPLGSIPPKK